MAKKVGQRARLSRYSRMLQRKQMKKNSPQRKRKSRKRNKSYFKKKKKQIEKVIIEDSKTLGYRALKGDFDNLRPIFHSGEKGRREMLKRYEGLRKNAAKAVKNHEESYGRKRKNVKQKKLREELSSGLCDICNVRMTKPQVRRQPWHQETLEHVLDHNSGGTLKKSNLAVLCSACNKVLNILKTGIITAGKPKDIYLKEMYDFFIFKQVLLISHEAAVRDFNQQYMHFWQHRFNVANRNHRKGVDFIEDETTKSLQKETVYWSLDCFNHSHCRHCGACNSTSLSHNHGHNIPYLID